MIKFILYEDNIKIRELYKSIIFRLMGIQNQNYTIIEADSYDNFLKKNVLNNDGNKIYVIDVEVPGKNGIDLAREIRSYDDWNSQIIIVSSHEQYGDFKSLSKILMLDFILKQPGFENQFLDTLHLALNIMSKNKTLNFSIKGEIYRIPYANILFIEKNNNENSCMIITTKKSYYIRETINGLEKKLSGASQFIRTHRSCIVNLDNVVNIDINRGIIYFSDRSIDMLARSKHRSVKERLMINSQ